MRYVPQHLRPKRGLDCHTIQDARDEVDRLIVEIAKFKLEISDDDDNATSSSTPAS